MEYAIEMLNITKEFPGIKANDQITLQVRQGEIHALLGENGAGKSTLMSILFGLYQPDEGMIKINGKEVQINDPNDANKYAIGMVHQHFKLVHNFTVLENIILGVEDTSMGFIKTADARKKVVALSEKYHLNVDPDAYIEDITVGMQQRVEILKMLFRDNDIDTVDVASVSKEELSEKMVGRKVNFNVEKGEAHVGETVLKVENLTYHPKSGHKEVLKNISFEVKRGEIVCIAGIDGNGQSELVYALTGMVPTTSGRVYLNNEDITKMSIRHRSDHGMAHIPEDRHKHGLVLDYSLAENLILKSYYKPRFEKNGFIRFDEMNKYADYLIDKFDVRSGEGRKSIARGMSGGNQQKAIIAREVDSDSDLLIAVQPTRGLDVGAIEFIHSQLVAHRDENKAVLLVSLELDEVMNVSDRILVMYEGEIVANLDPKTIDVKELGLYMAGSKRGEGYE